MEPGRSLLIVGDSFANNLEALFSCHYRDVYVVGPRHLERDGYGDWDLGAFMEENDVGTALLVLSMENLWTAMDRLS